MPVLNRVGDACFGAGGGLGLALRDGPAEGIAAMPYAVSPCWMDDNTIACYGCKAGDDPQVLSNWKVYLVDKTTRAVVEAIGESCKGRVLAGGGTVTWDTDEGMVMWRRETGATLIDFAAQRKHMDAALRKTEGK